MVVSSCVRNPVRGVAVDATIDPPTPTENVYPLVATSGSSVSADTTPVTGNAIAMPTGYSELMIYADSSVLTNGRTILHVKIDSTTTPIHLYPYQAVCLKGVSGKTVAFGAQTVAKNSLSAVNGAVSISVVPTKGKFTAPTGDTITVNPDQAPPNLWSPDHVHVVLQDEYQAIQIQPATYRRNIFLIESDGGANITPVRHIHVPANKTVNVNCRYQLLAFANLTGETIDIKVPSGATEYENTSVKWRPSFTPTASTTVSTLAELKAAMNGSTYDDILIAPGTYDMSGASYKMNGASGNYSTAMTRNLRIRSTTGNPDDVVFTNAPWLVVLGSGKSWILQGVSWSLDGVSSNYASDSYTGMLNFDGNVHLCDFKYFGAPTDVANDITQISWRSNSTVGPIDVVAAWGTISKAGRDGVTCNSLNSQAAQLQLIGTTHDGNGPNSNDQMVTCHTGGVVAAWGCRFKSTYTTNNPRIASDGPTSPIHLNYCYSRSGDFTSAGLSVNGVSAASASAQMLLFCDFPQMAGMYYMQYVVGTRAIQTSTNGPLVFTCPTTFIAGSDLTGNSAGTGFERLIYAYENQVTIHGTRLSHGFNIANQFIIDISANTTGNKVATLRNVLMRALTTASGSNQLSVGGNGSGGTQSIDFMNVLIDTDGSMAISSTAASSTSDGCRFKRAAAPTNWTSKVTAGTNTFSTTAFDLDASDVPTASGNCDSGIDPGFVGSIDIYGCPFLGGTFRQGCAERQEVRSGALLYPLVW